MEDMSANKPIKLKFTYLHQLFTSTVLKKSYANGYDLYKVNIKAGKYWFLKHNGEWKVFGDFKLARSLRDVIIANIENAVHKQASSF